MLGIDCWDWGLEAPAATAAHDGFGWKALRFLLSVWLTIPGVSSSQRPAVPLVVLSLRKEVAFSFAFLLAGSEKLLHQRLFQHCYFP